MLSLELSEALIRVFASALAGLLVGFSRKHYPAGIRTFALICLGTTIFTIISVDAIFASSLSTDPTRVISQIVTGIGFLGAGVIWKSEKKVGGLTTAAAIWTVAAIGILIGLGEFVLAVACLVITIAILTSKQYLDEG